MKTKNISYLIILAVLLGLQSCQKEFLELTPRLNKLEGNSYITEDDAFLALVSVYDATSHQEQLNFSPFRADIFSDDAFTGGEPPAGGMITQWQNMERSILDSETPTSRVFWRRCYRGIYRANQYLSKEEGINWKSEKTRARFAAEAKFLRAYFYWDLVRDFGWVPLVDRIITADEARNLTQSEPLEIYQFIAKDLLEALPDLPEIIPPNEYGRISKAAGQVLLARIYQYYEGFGKGVLGFSEDWTDGETVIDEEMVKKGLEDIISSGTYHLLENYADVHSWENENNAESILEVQYSEKSQYANWDDYSYVNGNFMCHICSPRNPSGDSTITSGWSFGMITWSLYNEFEPGDPRLAVTVYDANDSLTSYTAGYHNTGYFNNKLIARTKYIFTEVDAAHNYPKNHIDMRYAEVLLIASELYLDDNNARATDLLNEVRTRSLGISAALPSVTLDDIYHEKRVEFGLEGIRYWDLLRRGLDYAKEQIEKSYIPDPSYPAPEEFAGYYFDVGHMGMIPIPAEEIRNANEGVLEQKIPFYFGN